MTINTPSKYQPFTQLSNIVVTPYLGRPTDFGFEGFAENAVTNTTDYMDGRPTPALNLEALTHRRKAR